MHDASSSAAANVSLETRETATALLTEGPWWPGRDDVVSGRVLHDAGGSRSQRMKV